MKLPVILILSTAITGPALAGSLDTPAPEPVLASPVIAAPSLGGDWTGAYVGARLSYGDTNSSGDVNGDGSVDDLDRAALDGSGAIYGLQAGYLYDFGRYVVGGELGLNKADIDFPAGNGTVDNLHTAKLKVGYDAGRTLVFGTVGAAYADGDFAGIDYSDTGYVVGAGVEYLLTDSVSLGGEVNYHRFDDIDGSGVDLGVPTVGATMNFRF